jgi:hypothetical protein
VPAQSNGKTGERKKQSEKNVEVTNVERRNNKETKE